MSLRDYKPGDIIQDGGQPFCKTVSVLTQKGKVCDGCFKRPEPGTSFKRCTGCLQMYYCTHHCQKMDWKNGHKIECGSKTFKDGFSDKNTVELRCQLFRVYAFLKMKPEMAEKQFPLYDGTTRCFNDLLALQESFETPRIHHVCAYLAIEMSVEGLEDENVVEFTKSLLKIAGVLQNNAIKIYDFGEICQVGSGIYFEPSILKHSCKPNALFCTKGTRMEIRALAPIKKGEKPLVSYIGAQHLGKEDRKSLLMTYFKFNCVCIRCESEEDDEVDYHKLNNLVTFFKRCEEEESFARSNSEERILTKHRQMIGMLKKIYNEFDDRLAIQYRRTVFALVNGFKYLGVPDIKKLVEETRNHLKISFGEDHVEYIEFEKTLIFNKHELKSK